MVSLSQFSHLSNADNINTHLLGMLGGVIELMLVRYLLFLTHSKHTMNYSSLLLLALLVYLTGVLLCVFYLSGPYLLSFSTLYTSFAERQKILLPS